MKKLIMFAAFCFCSLALALGQTAPPTTTWNFTLSPISVPGIGQTVAGTEGGVGVGLTPNLQLGETTIIAPGNSFQYFAGRGIYNVAALANALNNHTAFSGLQFQFQPTVSAGVVRITQPTAVQHFGFTAGGIVNYRFGTSGTWALGAKIEYAKFPGLKANGMIASFGPKLSF